MSFDKVVKAEEARSGLAVEKVIEGRDVNLTGFPAPKFFTSGWGKAKRRRR